MRVIYPPELYVNDTAAEFFCFMAGSIEMGVAEEWQNRFINSMEDEDIILLNPRRKDWDSSWVQSADNPNFHDQVQWELSGIEVADLIVFYFDPNTKSPVTLMELGFAVGQSRRFSNRIVVYCPEGFWRKGNVDILCGNHKDIVISVNSFDELVSATKKVIRWKK